MKKGVIGEIYRWMHQDNQYGKIVNFKDKNYVLTVTGRYRNEERLIGSKYYSLFDENYKDIGSMQVILKTNNDEYINYMKQSCFKVTPKYCFELISIDIEEQYQNNGIGSFLLNFAIEDIEKFNKSVNMQLPLLIKRLTTDQNINFYKKWQAEYNSKFSSDNVGQYCPLIIKLPQIKEEYKTKKICPIKVIESELNCDNSLNKDFLCEKED